MPDLPPTDPPAMFLGVKIIHLVAGLAGGAVRALTRPDLSWTRRIGTGFAGALCAGYGTPVFAPVAWRYLETFKVSVTEMEGLVGFVLGMTGLTLADALIRFARKWRDNPTWPPPKP